MAFVRTRPRPIITPPRRFGVRDRGMGAANCPSLEQLQGIVDLSDPCQQEISASGDTVVPPLTAAQAAASSESIAQMTLAPTFLGVPMPYAVLGGVVLLLLLMPSGGRRR
jgi:hypothetical protein